MEQVADVILEHYVKYKSSVLICLEPLKKVPVGDGGLGSE